MRESTRRRWISPWKATGRKTTSASTSTISKRFPTTNCRLWVTWVFSSLSSRQRGKIKIGAETAAASTSTISKKNPRQLTAVCGSHRFASLSFSRQMGKIKISAETAAESDCEWIKFRLNGFPPQSRDEFSACRTAVRRLVWLPSRQEEDEESVTFFFFCFPYINTIVPWYIHSKQREKFFPVFLVSRLPVFSLLRNTRLDCRVL